MIHGVYTEPEHIIRKRSINQPLRILLSYDESVYRLDEDKFELINVSAVIKSFFYFLVSLFCNKVKRRFINTNIPRHLLR